MTLPNEVRALALRLGADPSRVTGHSVLRQNGEMKLSLASQRWHRFSARQTMAVTSCAFDWHARFSPFGYLSVTDALKAGRGQLDVTALGLIPLVRSAPSVALTKGEMLRYLAELPFAPDAWMDREKDKIGYEIPFTKFFYEYKPLRELDEIMTDIEALEEETEDLLAEIKEVAE